MLLLHPRSANLPENSRKSLVYVDTFLVGFMLYIICVYVCTPHNAILLSPSRFVNHRRLHLGRTLVLDLSSHRNCRFCHRDCRICHRRLRNRLLVDIDNYLFCFVTSAVHLLRLRRPWGGVDVLYGVTVAETVSDSLEAGSFHLGQVVLLAVFLQRAFPLCQEDFTILDGPEHGVRIVKVARCATAEAAAKIGAVARGVADGLATAGSAIDDREAAARDVVEDYRWATANARHAVATHAGAARLFVVEENPCIVGHAALIRATAAGKDRPVRLDSVLVRANVGTTSGLVRDETLATNTRTRREVPQFSFAHQFLALWWTQVLGSSVKTHVELVFWRGALTCFQQRAASLFCYPYLARKSFTSEVFHE